MATSCVVKGLEPTNDACTVTTMKDCCSAEVWAEQIFLFQHF
jgi:hypothetical protein